MIFDLETTGFGKYGYWYNLCLRDHETQWTVVEGSDPEAGLQDFINSFESKPIVLGHIIQPYDIPVLMHQLTKFRLLVDL